LQGGLLIEAVAPPPGIDGAGTRAVTVAIRPESIRLQAGGGEPSNELDGTVAEAVFLGNLVEYQVDVAGGPRLRVQADRHVLLEPGTPVRLAIPVAECRAMRGGGS
jgi:ABC-type Fe3+/spermidine/putrescine transport system ATPase subunit